MRLLRTPIPHEDESLMGYIIRLTEANGYDTPQWIFRNAGWKINLNNSGWKTFVRSYVKFDNFCELIGKLPHQENLFHKIKEFYPQFSFSNNFFNFEYSKFCPDCLRENDYYRKYWDLLYINVCPVHQIFLVDLCPNCEQKINWNRNRVSVCSCGYDLKLFEGEPLSCDRADFCRVVFEKIGLCESRSPRNNNPLNSLPLEIFWKFTFGLADFLARKRQGIKFHQICNKLIFQYLEEIYRSFNNFPLNIILLFNSIFNSDNYCDDEVIALLSSTCNNKKLLFVLVALEEYLNEPDSPNFSDNIFEIADELISCEEAAERLQISPANLYMLTCRKALSKTYLGEILDSQYFRLTDVELIHNHISRFIFFDKVLEIANLSYKQLLQLKEYKIIVSTRDEFTRNFGVEMYEEAQLTKLISKIRERLLYKPDVADEIDPDQVTKILSKYDENFGLFISKVLSGQIRPIRELNASGLLRFSFSCADVMNYVNSNLQKKFEIELQEKMRLRKNIKAIVKFFEEKYENGLNIFSSKFTELEESENDPYCRVQDLFLVARKIFNKKLYKQLELGPSLPINNRA